MSISRLYDSDQARWIKEDFLHWRAYVHKQYDKYITFEEFLMCQLDYLYKSKRINTEQLKELIEAYENFLEYDCTMNTSVNIHSQIVGKDYIFRILDYRIDFDENKQFVEKILSEKSDLKSKSDYEVYKSIPAYDEIHSYTEDELFQKYIDITLLHRKKLGVDLYDLYTDNVPNRILLERNNIKKSILNNKFYQGQSKLSAYQAMLYYIPITKVIDDIIESDDMDLNFSPWVKDKEISFRIMGFNNIDIMAKSLEELENFSDSEVTGIPINRSTDEQSKQLVRKPKKNNKGQQ